MLDVSEIAPYSYEYSENKWKTVTGYRYGRLTGHSLHYIGPYSGSFPPELVHYFLYKYSDPNSIVCDPFSGRGTTGLQAVLNNRKVIVNDLNPLAYVYSLAKLFPFSSKDVDNYLKQIPLAETKVISKIPTEKENELLAYFHPDTLLEINNLRQYLLQDNSLLTEYIKALLAGTSQGNRISNLSITMSALICFSPKYNRAWSERTGTFPEYREVHPRIVAKAKRLEEDGLKFRRDSKILCEDATKLSIEDNSIDLIITSPPYFNVINYAYDNRVRLWLIGHEYKDVQKKLMHTGSLSKYSNFIHNTISEFYRILKDDSWVVVVVGDVKKKEKTKDKKTTIKIINTAEIVAKMAEKYGFVVEKIINDALPEAGGTCGRATALTDRFNVSLDRCVVLKKGKPEERTCELNWDNLVHPS